MFFRQKHKLKKEYDEKLLLLLEETRSDWVRKKDLVSRTFEYNEGLSSETNVAESIYFFLFKEAKHRNIRAGGD